MLRHFKKREIKGKGRKNPLTEAGLPSQPLARGRQTLSLPVLPPCRQAW